MFLLRCVHAAHGHRWTRLAALIDEFDDRTALAAERGGFGQHALHDADTQAADEEGARCFAAAQERPADADDADADADVDRACGDDDDDDAIELDES